MIEPEDLKEIHVFGLCILWAGVCGVLSYLLRVQEGHVFRWTEFLLLTAVSMVAGGLAFQLLHYWGAPPDLSGAVCGYAGWMGTQFMKFVGVIVLKKAEVDPKSLKDKKGKDDEVQ